MLVQFTEFNSGKLIYIAHDDVTLVKAIENADKGSCLDRDWAGESRVYVQESPHEVVRKLNDAEKLVQSY